MKHLLKELCALDAVPGYERELRDYLAARVGVWADEITIDPLGNLLVLKRGKAHRTRPLVVAVHMDEDGFLVERFSEDGYLRLTPAGEIEPRTLIGCRVKVGLNKVPGVIALKAIHLTTEKEREKTPLLEDLYVDVGAQSEVRACKLCAIGDPACFDSSLREFGRGYVKAKALDSRAGCAVALKLLEEELPWDTYFAFTVGGCIGGRGAQALANRLDPGCVLVLGGTLAADFPDIPPHRQAAHLRQGAAVCVADADAVYSRSLRQRITGLAEQVGIKWQYLQGESGMAEAAAFLSYGMRVAVMGLALPLRNPHSASNISYLPDLQEMYKLAALFCQEVGDEDE